MGRQPGVDDLILKALAGGTAITVLARRQIDGKLEALASAYDVAPGADWVEHVGIRAGREPRRDLATPSPPAILSPHYIGRADVAAELDAKRAIDQGTWLATSW